MDDASGRPASPAYPVFLDLRGRPVLVVGGGRVAARKVEGLLAAGARVTVVAPRAEHRIRAWARQGRVCWRARGFEPGDLLGMELAFIATSDPRVNRAAAAEAERRGVWANVADDPSACRFLVPAVLRRGRLTVAVGTQGASPELAAWVRDRIDRALPGCLADLVELARRVREMARGRIDRPVRRLLDAGVAEDLERGDRGAAERKVAELLGPDAGPNRTDRPPEGERP